jgi:tetratricopeptide (TPR) repeat protein
MMKPRVFIGASRENQEVAEAIQQALDYASEVEVWDQGTFGASQYPLESLELKLDAADFAIFVFSPDDVTMMRGEEKNTVRDNVVFELGLFIGRLTRKRTFIVSPRNVDLHLPSDLAGLTPLNYDATRADGNLRAAVGSACTSIRAALKEHGALARPSREVAAQEAEPLPEDGGGFSADFFKPTEAWDERQYAHVYFVAMFVGREQEAQEIDSAFRASSLARGPEELAVWEAHCDWTHMLHGDNRGIKGFRDKAKLYPNNAKLKDFLGRVLSHYGSKAEAHQAFELAAEFSSDPALTGATITRAIDTSEAAEITIDSQKYRSILISAAGKKLDQTPEILSAMKALAEKLGLVRVSRGIDEIRLKGTPDNTSLRFDLAHQYSDDKQHALTIHHYQAIPMQERNGTVWNNLGVAFANLEMPGRAVEAYTVASTKGETIADGNLAHKLVTAGFLDQAKMMAENAVKIEGHHENVVGALSAIQTARDDELRKEAEAFSAARLEQEYLLDLGKAGLAPTEIDISGLWETPEGPFEIQSGAGGTWTGRGEIEKEATAGLGTMFSLARKQREITDVEYSLIRFGNVLEGSVIRRIRDYQPTSLLGLAVGMFERKVVIRVANDGQSLSVREVGYETKDTTWRRILSLTRHGSPTSGSIEER